jgi:hypothetical protein
MQYSENKDVYVGNLIDLSNSVCSVACSAGDGCDCDGDVDECISGGQD